ncbi:hypothetical protein MPC1_10350002 [Methylocella tundrae]|nr:hypothetical protein MPC1_10350002 [Methylocella tundrae]
MPSDETTPPVMKMYRAMGFELYPSLIGRGSRFERSPGSSTSQRHGSRRSQSIGACALTPVRIYLAGV